MSETPSSEQDINQEKQYYQHSLKDGYKGLLGAVIGTSVAELILWFGQIESSPIWTAGVKQANDNVYLVFAGVGFMFALRHVAQIWQAKAQLKQLSLNEQSNLDKESNREH